MHDRDRQQPGRRSIDRAPTIKLRDTHLDEPVSWISQERRAVSLRDWIATHTPTVAQRFGIDPIEATHPIPSVGELTEDEAREVVIARFNRRNPNHGFTGGGKITTNADYLREVLGRTEKGLQVISDELSSIGLIQELAEAGKLAPHPNPSESTRE